MSSLTTSIIEHLGRLKDIKPHWYSNELTKNAKLDGCILLKWDRSKTINLLCLEQKSIVPLSVVPLKQKIDSFDLKKLKLDGSLVIANYISTKARKILQEENINYIDTMGNINIKGNGLYIHIENNKSDRRALNQNTNRSSTKSGLKVMYQFLKSEHPLDINDKKTSFDVIANHANVSKDTVAKVIKDLIERKIILKKSEKNYIWTDKDALIAHWVQMYNLVLRPKLQSKKYSSIGNTTNNIVLPNGYQHGGTKGAELWCTNEVKFDNIINPERIIYTHKGFNYLFDDLMLVPDAQGNIEIIEAFWKDDSKDHTTADFIVIYADLMHSDDPRFREAAQDIHEYYLNAKDKV